MVSADSLNFDVLELIFAYSSAKDLPAIALVSKSFLAAVTPRLYRTLAFRAHHAKRYPKSMNAFSTVLAHPELATHVMDIDIRAVPILNIRRVHPVFIRDCCKVLDLCQNLRSFIYTHDSLPSFLPALEGKGSLKEMRICARLTTEQARRLLKLINVQKAILDYGSWNVMNILPEWIQSVRRTLTDLTIYASDELNKEVLEPILSELPQLLGLHVVGCAKINHTTVLHLVSYTPLLESLAFSVTDPLLPSLPPPSLYNLKHLAIDARMSAIPTSSTTLATILAHLQSSLPLLSSVSLKAPNLDATLTHLVINQMLKAYAHTLKRVAFFDCAISTTLVAAICKACKELEKLTIAIPMKDIVEFTRSISHSKTLRVLVDTNTATVHKFRPSFAQENVRHLMGNVRSLRRIVSDKRIWLGQMAPDGILHVSFDRQPMHGASTHWFIPHE